MISPRSTTLVRVPDLKSFQRAILDRLPPGPAAARGAVVVVPSESAADELRRTIERSGHPSTAIPAIVTRDAFYDRLRERLPGAPAAISRFAREVLLRRAARTAAEAGCEPPFNLRAALIAEILNLYDELRRRHRTVADFDRLITETLAASADYDRGAARLLQQTRFLTAAFTAFEAATGDNQAVDEHGVRALALAAPGPVFSQVLITTADQAADRRGLWTADFDLLTRLPGLQQIDVIATEGVLDAGYYHRLHDSLLPGIEDIRVEATSPPPSLIVPEPRSGDEAPRLFTLRDREEELADFVRDVKAAPESSDSGQSAFVFQRPLPYLYLARQVFEDAGLDYQAADALPLAGEPFAAAIDLLFAAAAADFTRGTLLELLRSPHFTLASRDEVRDIDRRLAKRKFFSGLDRLEALAAEDGAPLSLAAASARELHDAFSAASAPEQLDRLLAFIAAHEQLPQDGAPWYSRHLRARDAVLTALANLRDAHAVNDPSPLSIVEFSSTVRRWIDSQTFSPHRGSSGPRLLDARAAAYADVDDLRIAGLVESDWPERRARSIFYPQSLLAQLGWPQDTDAVAASRAQFIDLLRLPSQRVSLSTFTLEDDALVSPSALVEEIEAAGLPIAQRGPRPARAFVHESLRFDPIDAVTDPRAAEWLALRRTRVFDDPRFRGHVAAREAASYSVSKLERYLDCPFRYFAAEVLRLPEERDEQAWLSPQERGDFVHQVFAAFFQDWQARGFGAITADNLPEAIVRFETTAEQELERLPEADRALERTLLLGSAAAAGLAERAFAFEIEAGGTVEERLLEHQLTGEYAVTAGGETRTVRLRSKADRIDLLADGTLRIVDYKLGRAPDRKRALQLPIYGVCAEQALDGRRGRSWTVGTAGYVAFREKTAFVPISNIRDALAAGQERLIAAVEGIEAGHFPVQPDDLFLCNWCAYPGVCRKDYVGDE